LEEHKSDVPSYSLRGGFGVSQSKNLHFVAKGCVLKVEKSRYLRNCCFRNSNF